MSKRKKKQRTGWQGDPDQVTKEAAARESKLALVKGSNMPVIEAIKHAAEVYLRKIHGEDYAERLEPVQVIETKLAFYAGQIECFSTMAEVTYLWGDDEDGAANFLEEYRTGCNARLLALNAERATL